MKFNEKFMENCIRDCPEIFLGEHFSFKYQQHEVNGFYPDLIFKDQKNITTVVEVQRNALDRYHLYKCLEYRDLIKQKEKTNETRVIVVCNTIRERHLPLLKTHGIEFVQMEESKFLRLAKKHCSVLYEEEVRKNQLHEEEALASQGQEVHVTKPKSNIIYEFKTISWHYHDGPMEYLKHFYAECGRLGLSDWYKEYDNVFGRRDVAEELERFLDDNHEHSEAFKALYNPAPLNWELLKKRCPRGYGRELGYEFAKPRIDIIPYITIKDNLSVCWRPTGWDNPYVEDCDWKYWWDFTERSPHRPIDELMFIRGVRWLRPQPDREYGPYLRYNRPVVDAILICAVRAVFNTLVERLSKHFEVTLINDFDFTIEEVESKERFYSEHYVVDWEIYNVKEREEKQESEWLENFNSTYGISPESFIETYKNCLYKKKSGPKPTNRIAHTSKALKNKGLTDMTEGKVREIIERLQNKHTYFYESLTTEFMETT